MILRRRFKVSQKEVGKGDGVRQRKTFFHAPIGKIMACGSVFLRCPKAFFQAAWFNIPYQPPGAEFTFLGLVTSSPGTQVSCKPYQEVPLWGSCSPTSHSDFGHSSVEGPLCFSRGREGCWWQEMCPRGRGEVSPRWTFRKVPKARPWTNPRSRWLGKKWDWPKEVPGRKVLRF